MESQPQNPEFKNNPENFHPWSYLDDVVKQVRIQKLQYSLSRVMLMKYL